MAAVKEIEETCSALFQIFRQEIQSELKSEILELRTGIEKLKVSLVEKQVKKTVASEGCHQIKMIPEVAKKSSQELSKKERRKRNLVWFGVPECPATQTEEKVAADTAFLIDVCQRVLGLKLEVAACKRLRSKQA